MACLLIAAPLDASVILTELSDPLIASNEPTAPPIELDLDGNATIDFVIPSGSIQINIIAQDDNQVLGFNEFGTLYAADLAEGSFIGATPQDGMVWASGSLVMSACASGGGGIFCDGNFLGGTDYLGVEFDISGTTHYGWVEVESREFFQFVSIQRWAYESEPGVPIRAGQIPEPSALALLLVGLSLATRRHLVPRERGHPGRNPGEHNEAAHQPIAK